MRNIISISLDEDLKKKVDKLAKSKNVKRSNIVKDALLKYLFIEEMKNSRKELRPYAEKAGMFSEEDIFELIS
ncbi:MAG: ribbon-helix-helix domain-containing protein [Spirochaetia bacterium]|nr:ribbon-helix-helix domain-containing protein [Spirochaetia bacterium]